MDISDFADVADSDDQLEELVHDLLNAAAEILVDVDLPRAQVSELQGTGGEAKHVRIERPSLGPVVGDIDWLDDVDEAIAFAEHLETRYDYAIDQHYLSNLFKDAFGRAGQHLDTYPEHEERISNNVIADVHGQGKAELIAPLGGLDIETDRVRIRDGVEVRNFEDGVVLGEDSIPLMSDTFGGRHRVYNDSYLRIEFTEDDLLAKVPMQAINLYTLAISLSLGGLVRDLRTYITPITYSMHRWGRKMSSGQPTGFGVEINDKKRPQIQGTLELLEPYFELSSEPYETPYAAFYNFSGPGNLAISHYGRAINTWSIPDNTVTFTILGLESLFIQHTAGETPSRDVPRYAGFLIGNAVDMFDPLTVADYISSGYELRNQWAHGGKPDSEPSELEAWLWAILRAAIYIFYWLDTHTSLLDQGLPLGDALIDGETRKSVKAELDTFDVTEYMEVEYLRTD